MRRIIFKCKCFTVNVALMGTRGIASILFDEMTAGLVIRVVSLTSKPPVV